MKAVGEPAAVEDPPAGSLAMDMGPPWGSGSRWPRLQLRMRAGREQMKSDGAQGGSAWCSGTLSGRSRDILS